MDISPLGVARTLITHIPRILVTIALGLFRLLIRDDRHPQDFITAVIVAFLRPIAGTPAPLLKSQEQWSRDWGVWGPMWISKCVVPKPEDYRGGGGAVMGIAEAVLKAIEYLGDGEVPALTADLCDVEAEWTGYRAGVAFFEGRPDVSEREQYDLMMKEVDEGSPTILYFHGGAFW